MAYYCNLKVFRGPGKCYQVNVITKSATGKHVLTDPHNEFTYRLSHYLHITEEI